MKGIVVGIVASLVVAASVASAEGPRSLESLSGTYSCPIAGDAKNLASFSLDGVTGKLTVRPIPEVEFSGVATRVSNEKLGTVEYYLTAGASEIFVVRFESDEKTPAALFVPSQNEPMECTR